MRLIDADEAKIEVANYLLHCVDKGKINIDVTEVQTNLFNIINAQPTAYDVEAVVEKLAEKSWLHVKHLEFYASKICDDAIEIVRGKE